MPLDISEIRPDDFQKVDELLGTDKQPDGATVDDANRMSPRRQSVLSLVARDEGNIIGAILCYYDDQQGHLYQITITDAPHYQDLAKALVDKALLKLNAQGAHSCRIRLAEDAQHRPFWEAVKWGDRPELTRQPMSSSAVLDRLTNQEATSIPPDDVPPLEPEQIPEVGPADASNEG